MTATMVLILLLGLFTKHLIVDFPMQGPYHYLNKGTYGHPGGIQHSLWHGYGTFFVVLMVLSIGAKTLFGVFWIAALIATVDFVVHYHVDWAKMNLNKKLGWGPTTHEEFWWLLGLDQYLHVLTYLGIAYSLA